MHARPKSNYIHGTLPASVFVKVSPFLSNLVSLLEHYTLNHLDTMRAPVQKMLLISMHAKLAALSSHFNNLCFALRVNALTLNLTMLVAM